MDYSTGARKHIKGAVTAYPGALELTETMFHLVVAVLAITTATFVSGEFVTVSGNLFTTWAAEQSTGDVYMCWYMCTYIDFFNGGGPWFHISGSLVQVDTDYDEVWGVDADGAIFARPINGMVTGDPFHFMEKCSMYQLLAEAMCGE